LRDIHLPEPVSWWPLAPGWWLCLALLVMLTAAALWWWRGAPLRRLRRAALAELSAIETAYARDGDGHACAQAVSRLLRRVAAPCWPATPKPPTAMAPTCRRC
jgi:hypothetical protein